MSPPAAATVAAHRPKHARLAAGAARLVREDVVELVPAPALQPADVRAVAVAVLELRLRLRLGDRLVARVLLLGEAEVDERAVPCVPKRHALDGFARKQETPSQRAPACPDPPWRC